MRDTLQTLDDEFAFQTSGRFDLLAGEHVATQEQIFAPARPYSHTSIGAPG